MCGICGFIGPPDPVALQRMRVSLEHRGPDESGTYADGRVSLAHQRLSIVDLAGGHQPMSSSDGDAVVVFNGEIYNHPQLQPQFEATGASYHSRSDTETILHAYQRWGPACVEHLDGMFAFVIYDRRRKLLFGARDRLGKKPLYFTTRPFRDVQFAFASELKALIAHPSIAPGLGISTDGLVSYLLNDYVVGSLSILNHVRRLEPGCAFVQGLPGSSQSGYREWRYWRVEVGPESSGDQASRVRTDNEDPQRRIVELLTEAVERRMMSDVPVGVFLSGGVDSSSIVSILNRIGQTPLKTFSIGFREQSFDETRFAAEIAQRYGTEHFVREFGAEDLVENLPGVIATLDEPFADPSVLPTAVLSQLAAEHVKVVLGGDGADELFAGYDPFKAVHLARWYARLVPGFVHAHIMQPATRLLAESDRNMSLGFKISRFLRGVRLARHERVSVWMAPFTADDIKRLMPDVTGSWTAEQFQWRQFGPQAGVPSDDLDDVELALDFYQRFYLPDDILVKMDRASMMHSLEVRAPFLDTALVEYVNRLPSVAKYRRTTTKYLLKSALVAHGILDSRIVHRRKKGFGIPVARWMRNELRDYFEAALFDDWPDSLGMISQAEIKRLWSRHLRRESNHYKELWSLVMLSKWASAWLQHGCSGRVRTSSAGSPLRLPRDSDATRRAA